MHPVCSGAPDHAVRRCAAHLDGRQGGPDARWHVVCKLFLSQLQHDALAAETAVWLLSLRDGRKAIMLAVVHPCCLYSERWVPYNV